MNSDDEYNNPLTEELYAGSWLELVDKFEHRLSEYCQQKKHNCSENAQDGGGLWCVERHYFNYDCLEKYDTHCLCQNKEIAVAEAIALLWNVDQEFEECRAAFFSGTDFIFSDIVFQLAKENDAVEQLEKMRQTIREIVLCNTCYENVDRKQGSRHKVIATVAWKVIDKKRSFS